MLRAKGVQRSLDVTALEDKVVERAVVEILSPVYETDRSVRRRPAVRRPVLRARLTFS